jgi:hypothetical protein
MDNYLLYKNNSYHFHYYYKNTKTHVYELTRTSKTCTFSTSLLKLLGRNLKPLGGNTIINIPYAILLTSNNWQLDYYYTISTTKRIIKQLEYC